MESETVAALGVSVATTVVGWVIFMYLRNMKKKVRRHVLRNDKIDMYFKGKQ